MDGKSTSINLIFSAPMRLSLAGGGTDLPEAYMKSGARILAVAISTRIKIKIQTNKSHHPSPLCNLFQSKHPNMGVSVYSEIGSGAGLGGSGALAVSLVAADHYIRSEMIPKPLDLGLTAYDWERKILRQPVGFQDQLVAAFGSCIEMVATSSGEIGVHKRTDLIQGLESLFTNNFIFIETGLRRNANDILGNLAKSYSKHNNSRPATVEEIEHAIFSRNGKMFGQLLRSHWESKCRRLPKASTSEIDFIIQTAISAGADGAKAIGAGGGGFILISGAKETKNQVKLALQEVGYKAVNFSISHQGVQKEDRPVLYRNLYQKEVKV